MVTHAVESVGRRKKGQDLKTERLEIMVTPTWMSELEVAAKSWGMTVSEYVRLAVEEKKRRDLPAENK